MRHSNLCYRLTAGRAAAVIAIIIVAGCGTSRRGETETIVARVDGRPITASRLQEELLRQSITPRTPVEDEYNKLRVLDTLITDLAVRLEAEALDLSRDHVLHHAMRQAVLQSVFMAYFDEVVMPRIAVTEKDVDTYWREHPEQFTVRQTMVDPQQVVILEDLRRPGLKKLPAQYAGWDAEAVINDLYRRLLAGEDFDSLAPKCSQDHASHVQRGRIGWRYYDSTKVTPWMDSLFSFPVGRIMPPFFSVNAYFIVRINGRREAGELWVPDDRMRQEIAQSMQRERMQAWQERFSDSLLAAGNLEIFDSTLITPIPDLPNDMPMAVSNRTDTIFTDEFVSQSYLFKAADGSRNLQVADKKRLLEGLHTIRVFRQAMKDLGFLDRPQFVRTRADYLIRAAETRIRKSGIGRGYVPNEEEITAYYDEHADEFRSAQPVHVQHIVLDNPDTALAVKARLDEGADFVELARRYFRGDPEMRDVVYDLGFISDRDMPDEFFATAMQLKKGEISLPLKTEWGYHLIRVVDKDEGVPMRQARKTIRSRLQRRHRAQVFEKWRNDLVANHVIDIDHAALAGLPILPAEPIDTTTTTDTLSIPAP